MGRRGGVLQPWPLASSSRIARALAEHQVLGTTPECPILQRWVICTSNTRSGERGR